MPISGQDRSKCERPRIASRLRAQCDHSAFNDIRCIFLFGWSWDMVPKQIRQDLVQWNQEGTEVILFSTLNCMHSNVQCPFKVINCDCFWLFSLCRYDFGVNWMDGLKEMNTYDICSQMHKYGVELLDRILPLTIRNQRLFLLYLLAVQNHAPGRALYYPSKLIFSYQ